MNFYIATSDKTSYILEPYSWLFDKYCGNLFNPVVLGYSHFPKLPDRWEIVSLAERQNNIKQWSKNLFNYFNNITDEFVIFGLDDFFPIDNFDMSIFNKVLSVMQSDHTIGRYELGWGLDHKPDIEIIKTFCDFERFEYNIIYDIYKYGKDTPYRISTQNSLWRREYLLKYLNNDWSPHDFELKGSKEAINDGWNIIATIRDYAFRWVDSGAISERHPGMINVLGVKPKDIEEMIDLKLLDGSKLQYGMPMGKAIINRNELILDDKYRKFYE